MNRIDSMGDFIYVKDDVMDKDFCSHLISKFESDVENQYRGVTAGGLKEHVKNTTDLRISSFEHWHDEDQKVFEIVSDSREQYVSYLEKFMIGIFNLNDLRIIPLILIRDIKYKDINLVVGIHGIKIL